MVNLDYDMTNPTVTGRPSTAGGGFRKSL